MDIDEELDKFDGPAQEGGKVSEPQPFEVKITLVGSINLEALGPFLGGKAEDGTAAGTAIMALNTMINHAPWSRYPSKKTSFFPPSAQQPIEVGGGGDRGGRGGRGGDRGGRGQPPSYRACSYPVLIAVQVDAVEAYVI
jgi:hypothetical protein